VTRFTFIDREKAHHDVAALCRLLKVSRSGFYAWSSRPPSARALADEVLTVQIRTAFDDNRRVYGAPRIHAELADAGVRVGRKRVARLMRQAGIVGCHRRKRPVSISRQDPRAEAAPDRVDRTFVAPAPNQLWVADVTYVPTVQGWLYLACVTDVFSRMVIGWSMASHRKTDLVVDAVAMAVHRRGGHVPGVITTATAAGSTAPTHSSGSCAGTARWPAWAASRTASITRWPKACSPRWSASCSTYSPPAVSPPDARPSSPSSTTSRRSTTRAGGTRLSARSPRRRSKHDTLSLSR
jgi:hypothetical protein